MSYHSAMTSARRSNHIVEDSHYSSFLNESPSSTYDDDSGDISDADDDSDGVLSFKESPVLEIGSSVRYIPDSYTHLRAHETGRKLV